MFCGGEVTCKRDNRKARNFIGKRHDFRDLEILWVMLEFRNELVGS